MKKPALALSRISDDAMFNDFSWIVRNKLITYLFNNEG